MIPGWGLSQRLSRIVGPSRAKEMSLTGRFIDAQTALAWGLVNSVFPQDRLRDEALRLAGLIGSHSPTMVSCYKQLIDEGGDKSLGEALTLEQARSRSYNRNLDATSVETQRTELLSSNRNAIGAGKNNS